MNVRINGTIVENMDVRLSSDRKSLTLKTEKLGMPLERMAALLEGEPGIEVMNGAGVTSMYRGMKLTSLVTQARGGALTMTACLQVERIHEDTAAALEKKIEELKQTVDMQRRMIDRQNDAMTQMNRALEAASAAAKSARDAIAALEEGIAYA
ncbi:MAG: hypothetical protein IJD60_08605 [Clostridia bacterium]|nr:hypothetical protein [Clostridia bacterium]